MAKDTSIIISSSDFMKGVQPAYFGMQEIRGLNVTDKEGVMTVNTAPAKASASNVTDLIIDLTILGTVVLGVSYSVVYKGVGAGGGTWSVLTGGTGGILRGVDSWKGFFFTFLNTDIDVYTSAPLVSQLSFETLDASTSHPSITCQDGLLYIGNGYKIASLQEVGTFDPTNGATYSWSNNALDIPDNHIITSLTELGDYLIIGTDLGYIYMWDRISPSFNSLLIVEEGEKINSMITHNNLIYIQAGNKMSIYISNGTSVELFYQLPETLIEGSIALDACSNMIVKDRKILIGYGGISRVSPAGLYSIDLKSKVVAMENLISTENDGTTNGAQIPALLNTFKDSPSLIYSWRDESSYGVDKDTGNKYLGDEAYFISQFYRLSTDLQPKTFQRLEVFLSKDIDGVDSVKVYYRKTKNGAWVFINTFDTENKNSFQTPFTATARNIQFKVILNRNVEFLELRAF